MLICKSSEKMDDVPDDSVHLVVTSPPYNVGQEYERDMERAKWDALVYAVFSECYRVLVSGGRIAVNIANTGRSPYRDLRGWLWAILDWACGFMPRGEIIWIKGRSATGSTAWGSWCSASNPSLKDLHEYILVFSKEHWKRQEKGASTLGRDEFMELVNSVWYMQPEHNKRVKHPCPFPVELPRRLINLYTYLGDTVLDPFCGSGTTGVAAVMTGRKFIGYDTDANYIREAHERITRASRAMEEQEECNGGTCTL